MTSLVTSPASSAVDIDRVRLTFTKGLLGLMWIVATLVSVLAAIRTPGSFLPVAGIAIGLTALPTLSFFLSKASSSTAISVAVGLAGLIALHVYNFRWNGDGIAYQIDMHMAFFAGLAILAGMLNWRALVAYTAVVAFHHLGSALLLPSFAFPDGAPIIRVVLHGFILSLECGVLLWMNFQITGLFAATQVALKQAESERLHANQAKDEADSLKTAAEEKGARDRKRYDDMKRQAEEFRGEAEALMHQLLSQMELMDSTARTLEASAINSRSRADVMDNATRSASDSVTSVAGASHELSASIEAIVTQIANSNAMIGEATTSTGQSRDKVSELSASAQKIGDVVKLIQDIAEQTNLLALNATIEAARAGEMGKGFAVVASEVKVLAGQTAKAVQVISELVGAIQTVTSDTTAAISKIADQMDMVSGYTNEVARAIDQQSSATNEISESVTYASESTNLAAQEVRSVIETADRTKTAASSILSVSRDVTDAGKRLRTQINAFITKAVA